MERSGRLVDQSPATSPEVENENNCTPTLSISINGVERDNFLLVGEVMFVS